MKAVFPACIYAELLSELPDLNTTDKQIALQYLPLIVEHYFQSLLTEAKPLEYLSRLYCIKTQQIQQHSIGFSNRTLGLQLPHHKNNDGRKLRGALGRLRILKGTGHEAFRGCVVIPIIQQDDIVGFYAERIGKPKRSARQSYWAPLVSTCFFQSGALVDSAVYMCANPLHAIHVAVNTAWVTIATNQHFRLSDADCNYLVEKGVKGIFVMKRPDTAAEDLRMLKRTLKKFGLRYQRSECITEVTYDNP